MQNFGEYDNDDKLDPSGFLKMARLHQSQYRANILKLPFDTYGNYLTKDAAQSGHNFYSGFGIFDAVKKRYPNKYSKSLSANMLRSEHIPFNIFIPLDYDKNFCKNIFNEFLQNSIEEIVQIKIEYAPPPKLKYLNDNTSFDTYIEYKHVDGSLGILGVEVKYTEREYRIPPKSKQANEIKDPNSQYSTVMKQCGIFKTSANDVLRTDEYRQIWRNQLLGESILIVDSNKFKHFTSVLLFPKANTHFITASAEFIKLLDKNDNKFIPITYEELFAVCEQHSPDNSYQKWLEYLRQRYIA